MRLPFAGTFDRHPRLQAIAMATISSISEKPLADAPEGVRVFCVPEKAERLPVMSRFLD